MVIDEELWETVQVLAKENKTKQAVTVVKSIASHAVGRYSGEPVELEFEVSSSKKLPVEQLIF